jgi:transposase
MSISTTPPCRFIGCDVGKREIVVFDSLTGRTTTVPNEPAALAAFADRLDHTCLVICEATGGYEAALLNAILQAGQAIHRADARKVKAFIRSLGTLGKTDAIDARALSRYGQERHDRLARWHPRDAERGRLHALVMLRLDLVAQRTAFKNRSAAPGSGGVAVHLTRLLCAIETEIAAVEAAITALIRDCQPLAAAVETLRTIGGIGPVVAPTFLALMPELGTLHRKQAASLAGLAPHPRQSGSADTYRRTKGGRPMIKRILFMAALAAARHDPALAAFYNRLRSNGKKPLVALTAVMRKIVVIANAKLKAQLS